MNSSTHASSSAAGDRQAEDGTTKSQETASLISALSGREANRERAVSFRTRRVVQGSLGVIKERKRGSRRARAFAIAGAVLVLLLIAPLAWEATDSLIAGEHLGDLGNQLSLWAAIVCPTMLAAAVVAGWWRKRS